MRLLPLVLALGCAAPAVVSTPTPRCALRAVAQDREGAPVAGIALHVAASQQVAERRWDGVGSWQITTDADGAFGFEAPCGADIQVDAPGWRVLGGGQTVATPTTPSWALVLGAANRWHLRLETRAGARIAGALRRPAGVVEVPLDGVWLEGLYPDRVEGTLEVPGLPPRAWRPARSETVEQEGATTFAAVVRLGSDVAWVEFEAPVARQLAGVWCVDAAATRCIPTGAVYRCACDAELLAWSLRGWDLARLVPIERPDTPPGSAETREVCVDGDPRADLRATPEGTDALLFGAAVPTPRCLRVPVGQAITLSSSGRVATWPADATRLTPP